MNGAIVLHNTGPLPLGTELPGQKRVFEEDKLVSSLSFSTPLTSERSSESNRFFEFESSLGLNVYVPDSSNASKSVPESLELANATFVSLQTNSSDSKRSAAPRRQGVSSSSAKKELGLLANLLGISDKADAEEKPFKFNLFPGGGGDKDQGEDSGNFIMIDIDGSAGGKTLNDYLQDLDLKDEDFKAAGSKGSAEDEDDLLALMDSAK